jgi:molybdopterin-guanine dinucleotide biosynthesis protein
MAIVVVGGHSRDVGKTSVVAGIIAALPEMGWTAVKITQFGHGICSVNGESCDCASDEHTQAISEERSRAGDSDTSRFLVAGAQRALWVRTKQGWLAEAMPALRQRLAEAGNVIMESNSVMRFLRPDVYLSVLNFDNPDFKDSAREYLDLAHATVWHGDAGRPQWQGVSQRLLEGKTAFEIHPPRYVSDELVDWLRSRLARSPAAR